MDSKEEGERTEPKERAPQYMEISPAPKPQRKRKLWTECVVAGWNFQDLDDIWDELDEGTELALVRQRDNEHDYNAVAVALKDDYDGSPDDFDFSLILGYVPRTENIHIAKMLDMGWGDAFTAELTTVKQHGAYDSRLRMSIYIESKEEMEDDETEKAYALRLDDGEFTDFTSDLDIQGFTSYCWGGFPIIENAYPEEKDNVFFIYKQKELTTIYLMHVIAIGEKADILLNLNETEQIDDCVNCILTNVKGPIVKPNEIMTFLDDEEIDNSSPRRTLSKEAVRQLKKIM